MNQTPQNRRTLIHYASPYYDPVKAHEYYMRPRELKGRNRSSASLSDKGKEVWSYTKNQITTSKKASIASEKEKTDAEVKTLRNNAKATRERISSKLKELKEKLTTESQTKKSQIDKTKESRIEQYQNIKIPSNVSAERKAQLRAEKAEKIAEIRNDAKADKATVTEETKIQKSEASASAKAEKEQVSLQLKSAISAAREAYKQIKANITASYETIYQNEYDKIKSEYAKTSKRKKS